MTQGAKVLLLAEASAMRRRLAGALSAAGYSPLQANSIFAARATLSAGKVALVAAQLDPISELALEFARDVSSDIPLVVFLDRPEAAELFVGASIRLDDIVLAPFASSEVTARIRTVLARRATALPLAPQKALVFSGWSLDVEGKTLADPTGRCVDLTPAEFLLLETLVRRAGRVQTREQLLDAIAKPGAAPFDRTIDNLISRLRRKIEDEPRSPQLIVTIHGFGYKLDLEPRHATSHGVFVSLPPRRAVVVLPFNAADADTEALAACLTEDVVGDLARVYSAPVIAGSTAANRAAQRWGAGPVSRKVGGHYAITGRLRREGPGLCASVQLIDAASGAHLWTARVNVETAGPAVYDPSVVFRIVHNLKVQLAIAEGGRAELARETDANALVARGRAIMLSTYAPEPARTACRLFEGALTLNGGDVDAMAGLGATLVRGVTSCWSLNPIADQRRAGELLRQACLAAPDHSEANGARAKLLRFQGKTAEAISILQRWTEIDPSNPSMLTELGIAYMYLGVPQKALSCVERAVDISPNAPNIGLQYWAMASCYQSLGHAREALTLLLSARASNPALPYVRGRLAGVFGQLGEIHEARQELDAARSLSDIAVRGDYTTLAAFRSLPQAQHPEFVAQCEPTLYAGLRKAGMPES